MAAVCDFDNPKLLIPEGVFGVNFGIINIATDSFGNQHCGARLKSIGNATPNDAPPCSVLAPERLSTIFAKSAVDRDDSKNTRTTVYPNASFPRFHCENVAGNIASKTAVTQPMFAHECAPYAVESRLRLLAEQLLITGPIVGI
ncbi:MAG: hypothetical protein ACU4EQ_01875 [Candidatus Nitrosoglobus sp.]